MKTYILDTPQGYATHRFTPDLWDTTQNLDDSSLYTFEAESLEAAIETIGEFLGGIRYRRAGSASFQDKNLNTFTVLDLAEDVDAATGRIYSIGKPAANHAVTVQRY